MLHLITGKIGSGKTEKLYSIIDEVIAAQKDEVLLIVPEQYSFETEKNIIARMGAQQADKVSVYSFTFLAKFLLNQFNYSNKPEINDSVRAVLMLLALENISDHLDVYSKSKYSAGFTTEILAMIKEFRQCGICADDLLASCKAMEQGNLKSKLLELSLILRSYDSLVEQSYIDDETSLERLRELIPETDWFNNKVILIDGFRGFTAQELRLIADLLPRSRELYITICTDKIFPLSDKNSVFAHTRRTASKLIDISKKCGMQKIDIINVVRDNSYENEELETLEKSIYSLEPEIFHQETKNIEICSAENFVGECDYVASKIKKLISEENYRCRDIAVISRDSSSYEQQIKASLKKYDVPVYIDKRQEIMTQPLINFVLAALKIAGEGFSIENIMRLLKTRLTTLSEEEIALLENFTIMWHINGNKWYEDFNGHPEGLGKEMLEKDAQTLENINKIRKSVVTPLIYFRNKFKNKKSALEASKAIYKLLCDFNVSQNLKALAAQLNESQEYALAQEQNRIWEILMQILDSVVLTLGETKLSAQRFEELFRVMVSRFSVGTLPAGLDEVTIGSADRIRVSSPKVVFALGVNDGIFPYIQTSKRILSRTERSTLMQYGLTLGQSAQEDVMEERFIAYNTLCSPIDKLYVSYTRKSLTGEALAPSELIFQIKKIFPNCKTADTVSIDKTEFIRSKKSAFEIMSREWSNQSALLESLKQFFENDSEYSGRFRALKRAANKTAFLIEDKNVATKLFGHDMYMSASRVETYYKCPFEYFCKYGLKASPQKTAELDPMQKGSIVHYVLEKLIKKYGSQKLCEMGNDERKVSVMKILEDYFNSNMSVKENNNDRFDYLYTTLGDTILSIVQRMVREFSVSSFEPIAFELPIDNTSQVKPLEIKLSDSGTLKLTGVVDRVDAMKVDDKTFIRVIDYKLSGKKFQLSDVLNGLNMQMLIYLFSIWKQGSGAYEEITPAGILYMPVKATTADLGRYASEDEIVEEQIKSSRMNGLVLDNSSVIVGMDKTCSSLFIPVKYDEKNQSFKGSLISLSEFSALFEKVKMILKEMGDSLHSGKIEAMPVFSQASASAYTDACKFCDYKSVCGFEKDNKRKELKAYSDNICFEILRGGEASD